MTVQNSENVECFKGCAVSNFTNVNKVNCEGGCSSSRGRSMVVKAKTLLKCKKIGRAGACRGDPRMAFEAEAPTLNCDGSHTCDNNFKVGWHLVTAGGATCKVRY